MSDFSDREDTKQIAWVTTGLVTLVITLFILVYKHCDESDARRLECVKLGKAPAECEDLFDSRAGR